MLDRVIYSQPEGRQPVQGVVALPEQTQVRQRNPVTVLVNRGLRTVNARPVAPMPSQGGMSAARALLHTPEGGISWLETKLYDPPSKAWQELIEAEKRGDSKYKAERMLTRDSILLSAFSTDKDGSPTVAAFGFSEGFDDEAPAGEDGRSLMSKVLTTAVDWLRERPPAPDIAPKSYGEYLPPKNVSTTHILHLPVFSTLVGIVVLGLGVWVYRRK